MVQTPPACAGKRWQAVATLPDGFTGNAGVAGGTCQYLVVGELVDRATASQSGAVVLVDRTTATVSTTLPIRTLWDVVRAGDGTAWAAGESVDGKGVLLKQSADGWDEVPVPDEVASLNRLAWVGGRLLTLSVDSDRAILSAYSPEDGWRRLAATATDVAEGRPRPDVPRLWSIATGTAGVVVGGTDGFRGVVLLSVDGGATVGPVSLPDGAATAVTAVAWSKSGLIVAGYGTVSAESYEGVVFVQDGAGWREHDLPPATHRIWDAVADDGAIYLLADVGEGQEVLTLRGGGVEREALRETGFARFIQIPPSTLSIVGSGLVARSLP